MRKVFAFVISIFVTCLIFEGTILAEDNRVDIDYNAQTNKFSIEEEQDLFVNLKQVVPGDNLTQNINLEVMNLKSGEVVKIYLKAENSNEDYDILESLNGVSLTVDRNGESITEKISKPILIGSFPKDKVVNIDVNLVVDQTVGNEIANLDADIDWIFTAETMEGTKKPKTGDDNHVAWVVGACGICLCGIFLIIWLRKKKYK